MLEIGKLVYLCPYLLVAWKGKTRPWFSWEAKEDSNRNNGLVLLSVLVAWPFAFLSFGALRQQDGQTTDQWLATTPLAVSLCAHFFAISKTKSRKLVGEFASIQRGRRASIMILSVFLYAIYIMSSIVLGRHLWAH